MNIALLYSVILLLGVAGAFMFGGFRCFRNGLVLIPVLVIAYLGAAAGKSLGTGSHYDLLAMYSCWALGLLGFMIGCLIKLGWHEQWQHS